MSHPRIHETLKALFESKDRTLIKGLLSHADFSAFAAKIHCRLTADEMSSAFVHSSFSHEFGMKDQEVLEFLGDAVLGLVITEKIVSLYPTLPEGKLSKMRSFLVNESSLSKLSRFLNLGELIILGKGEFMKKTYDQDAVLADTFEALVAVLYKFEGLDFVRDFILKLILATNPQAFLMENLDSFDAKSKLQEWSLKKYKKLPVYKAEAHGEEFLVELFIDEKFISSAVFRSKKIGEKTLAENFLKNLN